MKARDAIRDAMREIGVLAVDEDADAQQIEAGKRRLSRLLASWQGLGYCLWLKTASTVTLTGLTAYTLAARPFRVLSARHLSGTVETPLQELTRQEYDDLTIKTSAGVPTCFCYDRQRDTGVLYVWPVAATGTLKLTVERALDLPERVSDDLDVPVEWEEALVLNLAAALAPVYTRPAPVDMARLVLAEALAADREGSVYFR